MPVPSRPSPRVATGSLVICGSCHGLRGPVPDRDDGIEQLCDCAPPEVRQAQPLWGGDHNTYAELCRCCGLVLLPSGTRWSVWFCDSCKPLVLALNRAVGRCVVPIGRHSIMNGIRPRLVDLDTTARIEELVTSMKGLFGRIIGLDGYACTVVAENLQALGFAPGADVDLGTYLSTAHRSPLTPEDAFMVLLFRFALGGQEAS